LLFSGVIQLLVDDMFRAFFSLPNLMSGTETEVSRLVKFQSVRTMPWCVSSTKVRLKVFVASPMLMSVVVT
jgi:hypothetical protein